MTANRKEKKEKTQREGRITADFHWIKYFLVIFCDP